MKLGLSLICLRGICARKLIQGKQQISIQKRKKIHTHSYIYRGYRGYREMSERQKRTAARKFSLMAKDVARNFYAMPVLPRRVFLQGISMFCKMLLRKTKEHRKAATTRALYFNVMLKFHTLPGEEDFVRPLCATK